MHDEIAFLFCFEKDKLVCQNSTAVTFNTATNFLQ